VLYNRGVPIPKLEADQLQEELSRLPGWAVQSGKLHREFHFPDFAHAVGFMMTAAVFIEKQNHHPEWSNVYDRVVVDLVTHDSSGITRKDVELAVLLSRLAEKSEAS
jgi:4a-hydroxytetrahydrobiopterin dehydratase